MTGLAYRSTQSQSESLHLAAGYQANAVRVCFQEYRAAFYDVQYVPEDVQSDSDSSDASFGRPLMQDDPNTDSVGGSGVRRRE